MKVSGLVFFGGVGEACVAWLLRRQETLELFEEIEDEHQLVAGARGHILRSGAKREAFSVGMHADGLDDLVVSKFVTGGEL